MAIRYATKTGVWSDVTVWNGGASLPGVGDSVHANGYTVTIDQDINVATLSTAANGAPPAAGGGFLISSMTTRVLTCNIVAGTSRCLYVTATTGTLTIVGDSTSGTATDACGIWLQLPSNVALTVTGKVTGGTGASAFGVRVESGSGAIVTIQGDCIAGVGGNAIGIYATNTAVIIDVWGSVVASTVAHGISTPGLSNRFRTLVDAPNGRKAVYAPGWIMQSGQLCTETIMDDQLAAPFTPGSQVILSNYVSASPPPSDVRAGVIYGPSNTLAGTLAMPVPDQVAYGVPVDASTGTATLKLAGAATAIGAQLAAAVNGG